MSCFRSLRAFRSPSGTVSLVGKSDRPWSMELPCGRCVGCKMDRARAWSIRIGHEASCWDANCFVTLTYEDGYLGSPSLEYADFQEFMRRLRKKLVGVSSFTDEEGAVHRPLRFFVAGEYGKLYRRPHWHAVLFNLWFQDSRELQNGSFTSALLDGLWGMGGCHIGRVTAQSAAYVAGYTQSKSYGREAEKAYFNGVDPDTGEMLFLKPEFCQMSRDPGIGAYWYRRFGGDLFPLDKAVQEGKTWKVPRYYFEKLKVENPELAQEVAYERCLRAEDVDPEESSPERRAVKEEIAERRVLQFSQRRLE